MPIRVLLAEDNLLVREGVRTLIAASPDLELVAVCEDFDSVMRAMEEAAPDVVLTDIRMPPTGTDEGIRIAETLRASHPDTGVVVLSQYAEPAYAIALLEHGSQGRGYLLKERLSDADELTSAIRTVADGGSVIDPKVIDVLVAARSRDRSSPLARLTPREREVLSEMAQGGSNHAIATALFLTERAVEKHINSIFSKLALTDVPDVHRRVKAVLLFLSDEGG